MWARVAKAWEDATGVHLDMSCPRLTVLGLHPRPQQTAMPPEKARHKATEPAWRLPHAVTLLHNSRSTKRAPKCIWHIDMVHHPHDLHDTKRASPRHICRAVKQTRKGLQHAYSTSRPRPRHPSHIVAPPLQENWAALLMRAAPPRMGQSAAEKREDRPSDFS